MERVFACELALFDLANVNGFRIARGYLGLERTLSSRAIGESRYRWFSWLLFRYFLRDRLGWFLGLKLAGTTNDRQENQR